MSKYDKILSVIDSQAISVASGGGNSRLIETDEWYIYDVSGLPVYFRAESQIMVHEIDNRLVIYDPDLSATSMRQNLTLPYLTVSISDTGDALASCSKMPLTVGFNKEYIKNIRYTVTLILSNQTMSYLQQSDPSSGSNYDKIIVNAVSDSKHINNMTQVDTVVFGFLFQRKNN